VIIGTRLLPTKECPIHENVKQALLNATELDTSLIMRSINATHRVWRNASAEKCAELEASGADFSQLYSVISGDNAKRMYDGGDVDAGIVSCGQGIGLCKDIPTVSELFDRMMFEARETALRCAPAA
jgi:nitronate monooxygenase